MSANNFKNIKQVKIHILSTQNNTKITVTNLTGDVFLRSTCGEQNFRGSVKAVPYAAEALANFIVKALNKNNTQINEVHLLMKGIGAGKEAAAKQICQKLPVVSITDRTAIPHAGCRPPKKRRV